MDWFLVAGSWSQEGRRSRGTMMRRYYRCRVVVWSSVLLGVLVSCRSVTSGETVEAAGDSSRSSYSDTDASFFGNSYVKLPTVDSRSETDIRLLFRTSRPDGLLLLAAGSIDYCIIALQAGSVVVRIDLGSGDAALSSPRGSGPFNDLRWHTIHVQRSQGRVRLLIDDVQVATAVTPGRFFELNIDRDIFIGGTGAVDRFVFFGNYETFRGCLREVFFNGRDVLRIARDRQSQSGAPPATFEVAWNCSAEFDARSDEPISFISDSSYISLPSIRVAARNVQQQLRILFDVRTLSRSALVVFNSGRQPSSQFISLEIIAGEMKLQVGSGDGVAVVTVETLVCDGEWHHVEITVSSTSLRLSIDGEHQDVSTSADSRNTNLLNSSLPLYVGGVDPVVSSIVVARSLESLGGRRLSDGSSIIGCIKNLKVNGQTFGLHDAITSRGLLPGCVWGDQCTGNPCSGSNAEDTVCEAYGLGEYRCLCDRPGCDPSHELVTSRPDDVPPLRVVNDILLLQDLVVVEGNRSTITEANIFIDANFQDVGIRESSVVLRVVNPPTKGAVFVDSASEEGAITSGQSYEVLFSLSNLRSGHVKYIHDGSEGISDSIGMQLEFLAGDEDLPKKFARKYGFTLMVRIIGANDKPELTLPEGGVLAIVPNTGLKITSSIFNVTDRDNKPTELEYLIEYLPTPGGDSGGFFEFTDGVTAGTTRTKITRFKHSDIVDGFIRYVHQGALSQQLRIEVSDGRDVSERKILRITAVPLELILVANNDLSAPRGGSKLIAPENLAFRTNAVHQEYEVHYVLSGQPYEGEIQRQQFSDNQWTKVTSFSQKHIDRKRLRYLHHFRDALSRVDSFKFRVSVKGLQAQEHEFRITIVDTRVSLVRSTGLSLQGVRERAITADELTAVSTMSEHGPKDVVYQVISSPRKGHVLLVERKNAADTASVRRRLSVGANFSQADINDGRVIYRLQKALGSRVDDDFEFQISVPGVEPVIGTFEIKYEPPAGELRFINNGLVDVLEGGSRAITLEDLATERQGMNFRYTIIDYAQHGAVNLVDSRANPAIITHANVSIFTNENIRNGQVYYQHDDSETDEDSFSFTSTPIIDPSARGIQEINELSGVFDIRVVLRNDNAPQRIVDRPLHIVAGRGRVILSDSLRYIDPDVNFDSERLEYDCDRGFTDAVGAIVRSDNRSVILHRFRQSDITAGRLYFKHYGNASSTTTRTTIRVTDGQYTTTGVFEVQISEPYVRVSNISNVTVERGKRVAILRDTLQFETNVDVDDAQVRFVVDEPPKFGVLRRGAEDWHMFTLADIVGQVVSYEHDDGTSLSDDFRYLVGVENIQTHGVVRVNVLRDGLQHPPKVVNNRVAMVDELDVLTISADLLNLSHPVAGPRDVRFSITVQPRQGKLSLLGSGGTRGELTSFTQDDINAGRLQYEHTEEGMLEDLFHFDVQCDSTAMLHGLEFVLDIVPAVIPLIVANLTVAENGVVIVSADTLQIPNKYYASHEIEFLIMKEPAHGHIELLASPGHIESLAPFGLPISQFTMDSLRSRRVIYTHDGSETTFDSFLVMARLSIKDRQSSISAVHVTITPTNDQAPQVVVNKKLLVWTGSRSLITKEHLMTVDNDTGSDELTYRISSSVGGEVSLVSASSQPIRWFTQRQIYEEQVTFELKGFESGSFQFQVSDGVSSTPFLTFNVESRPLALIIHPSTPLRVFPHVIQPITSANLRATTNDTMSTRPIVYTITTAPVHGHIVTYNSNGFEEVPTFTQDDVDQGLIRYKHTAAPQMHGGTQEDVVVFDIRTAYAYAPSLTSVMLHISVSYDNINEENMADIMTLRRPSVDEGGRLNITKSELDITKLKKKLVDGKLTVVDIGYVIDGLPHHGELRVRGEKAVNGTNISQVDINRRHVQYIHDGTDTLWDSFSFIIQLEMEIISPTDTLIRRLSQTSKIFNITINPINDQPFYLNTTEPGIRVLQGSRTNITRLNLFTEDKDTQPAGILYEIEHLPSNGRLIHLDTPDVPIVSFTQADIDTEKISFEHDGTPFSGAFQFKVSDGAPLRHKPITMSFTIKVDLVTLTIAPNSSKVVELLQGHAMASFTSTSFSVLTNGTRDRVTYNVTEPPAYGTLYLRNAAVLRFTQRDVDDGDVAYLQTDMRAHKDAFEFVVYDSLKNEIRDQRANVIVVANLQRGKTPMRAYPGGNFSLTLGDLDASALATATGSDPVYVIVKLPLFGSLSLLSATSTSSARSRSRSRTLREVKKKKVKTGSSSGSALSTSAKKKKPDDSIGLLEIPRGAFNFTHSDIVNNRVLYQPDPNQSSAMRADRFEFILTARNVQPVASELHIDIFPSAAAAAAGNSVTPKAAEKSKTMSTTPATDGAVTELDPSASAKQDGAAKGKQNYLMIVLIVCSVTIVVIVVIITIKCLRRRHQNKLRLDAAKEDSRSPLSTELPSPTGPSTSGGGIEPVRGGLPDSTTTAGNNTSTVPLHLAPVVPIINVMPETPPSSRMDLAAVTSNSAPTRVQYPVQTSFTANGRTRSGDREDHVGGGGPAPAEPPLGGFDGPNTGGDFTKKDQVVFDWENVDPELLQHCRKTTPVLHKNQYWV